jgi:hypothetical protein
VGVHAGYGLGALHRTHHYRCLLKEYGFLLVRRTRERVPDEYDTGGWDIPDAGAGRVHDADHTGRAVWVYIKSP